MKRGRYPGRLLCTKGVQQAASLLGWAKGSLEKYGITSAGWQPAVQVMTSLCATFDCEIIRRFRLAAFRVGSCEFVDHSFWPRKEDDPRNHKN
jgi:hypothetical protein